MSNKNLKIYLAAPRGFCAGVDRAIEIVKKSIDKFGAPVYVRHEIVHNKHVVESLKKIGAIFVEELDEIKDKSRPVIFSAHGVPKSVPEEASDLNMMFVDANKYENISKKQLSFITQTTLSVDDTKDIIAALKSKFPDIKEPKKDDICYATTNRQSAVKEIADKCDMFFVIGSRNSSNSVRLVEVAKNSGCNSAELIHSESPVPIDKIKECNTIGISSGASAPEILVEKFIAELKNQFTVNIEEVEIVKENITFKIPGKLN